MRGFSPSPVSDSILISLAADRNIDKDYEWYSEDFLGCGLDERTVIRINDVLDAVEERLSKIVGVSLSEQSRQYGPGEVLREPRPPVNTSFCNVSACQL